MQIVYYEVYDCEPFLDERRNENTRHTLIGRWKEWKDAIYQGKQYMREKLALSPGDFERHLDYLPEGAYRYENQDTKAVCGLFFKDDKLVRFEDDWEYGRYLCFVNITKIKKRPVSLGGGGWSITIEYD